jgi:hypothetical protein
VNIPETALRPLQQWANGRAGGMRSSYYPVGYSMPYAAVENPMRIILLIEFEIKTLKNE